MTRTAPVQLMRHMGPGDDRAVHVFWKGQTRTIPVQPLISVPDETEPPPAEPLAAEWSDDRPPWAGGTLADFAQGWPSGLTVVDLVTSGTATDLRSQLIATLNANGSGRAVVRLPEGTHHLTSCPMIGSSGDPLYAFGFWDPRLKGLLGQGADRTIVQLDAGAISAAQVSAMSSLDPAAFKPLQLGMMRLDGSAADPVLLGGITFCAADQRMITAVHPNLAAQGVKAPQPAPFQGVVIYPSSSAVVNNCRFVGAAHSLNSAPPFEMANATSQYGTLVYRRCEFDGRLAPWLNANRPRRCNPIMANNETSWLLEDCWLHHSNVNRIAINDQNRSTSGPYKLVRCKIERMADGRNVDPSLNSGQSLGGWSDPAAAGWESCNSPITVTDSIICQDNGQLTYQSRPPSHVSLDTVGSRNPQGGRFTVTGCTFRNSGWPTLDGFATFVVGPSTFWATDGFATTLMVYGANGKRLTAHKYTGTWPPSASYLATNGLTPATHFIVRSQ